MTEPEEVEGEDGGFEEPIYLSDPDGQAVILNPQWFFEKYGIDAAQYRGGTLFGLDSDSRKRVDLEAAHGTPTRKLRPVQ